MKNKNIWKTEEKAVYDLRSLYETYGYMKYKMNKFEEYDLYVKNKDFLVSDRILTFHDTNGKLMALKPDVTLSIIKNTHIDEGVQKVYYHENVYRVAKGTDTFKEIMQTGLECIGAIDTYHVCEVIALAAQSLAAISSHFVLDISHMGIVSAVLDTIAVPDEEKAKILACIGEKNIHDIRKICAKYHADCEDIAALVSTYGSLESVLAILKQRNGAFAPFLEELEKINAFLKYKGLESHVCLDFSIVNDRNYYNGIVFRGFIEGIPTGVLSGGQYDRLLEKLGRNCSAIGFAVYLDMLERLETKTKNYDVDIVLLYDADTEEVEIADRMKMFTDKGSHVLATKTVPKRIKYRQLIKLTDRGG